MEKNNIIIIDKTLMVLWEKNKNYIKQNISFLVELCRALNIMGSSYFEVTEELFNILKPLVTNEILLMSSKNNLYIESVQEYEQDIKELICLDKKYIRISGLSDLIFFDYKMVFTEIIDRYGKNIEVEICNKYGCSVAMANEWINCGGTKVVGSFSGIGGYTPIESLLCSLKFINKLEVSGDTTVVPQVLKIFEKLLNERMYDKMPIIGEKIFDVESGIHVDGIIKNPENYEPYSPSNVGRKRNIIIGKHTGRRALELKLKELNIKFDISNISITLDEIKKESNRVCRGLNDSEIYDICNGRKAV